MVAMQYAPVSLLTTCFAVALIINAVLSKSVMNESIDRNGDGARAQAIRNLCLCRGEQRSAELWEVIFVACEESSAGVRLEALHVIEDSTAQALPNTHGLSGD